MDEFIGQKIKRQVYQQAYVPLKVGTRMPPGVGKAERDDRPENYNRSNTARLYKLIIIINTRAHTHLES